MGKSEDIIQPVLRPRMPELDSLRGIAVLGVLTVHAFAFSYGVGFKGAFGLFMHLTALGKLGVNLFFVLSGFLITGILLDSRAREDFYPRFYYRRALRVFPPYFATILIVFVIGGGWKYVALCSVFLANFTILFGVAAAYGPLWSLAVEEQFYLLWPTVVRRMGDGVIAGLAGTLVLGAPLVRFFGFSTHMPFYVTWYNCDGLALGAIVQFTLRRWRDRRSLAVLSAATGAGAVIALLGLTRAGLIEQTNRVGFALQNTIWDFAFAALLISMLLLGSGPWRRFATPRPLMFIGWVSYGLYLVHLLIYGAYDAVLAHLMPSSVGGQLRPERMVLRFIVAGSAAVLVAYLSRRYYEEAFLQKKDSLPRFRRKLVNQETVATELAANAGADD